MPWNRRSRKDIQQTVHAGYQKEKFSRAWRRQCLGKRMLNALTTFNFEESISHEVTKHYCSETLIPPIQDTKGSEDWPRRRQEDGPTEEDSATKWTIHGCR